MFDPCWWYNTPKSTYGYPQRVGEVDVFHKNRCFPKKVFHENLCFDPWELFPASGATKIESGVVLFIFWL